MRSLNPKDQTAAQNRGGEGSRHHADAGAGMRRGLSGNGGGVL